MPFLHEIHEVAGAREDAFEAAFRGVWLPALAQGADARLLYFLHHAHGSGGPSYQVVTITAIRDGAAWQRLAQRVASGDLAAWVRELDDLRHDVTAKLLVALPWSPWQALDLESVPVDGALHEPSLFMEDTVWPFEGRLEEYVIRSGAHYAAEIARAGEAGHALLRVERPSARPSGATGAARSCCGRRWCNPGRSRRCSRARCRPRTRRPACGCTTRSRAARSLAERCRARDWSPWH
jgi:hypothetical protein